MCPHAYERANILEHLANDINYARALFTNLISNMYRDWIKLLNNESSIDNDIEYALVPEFLTASPNWRKVYAKLDSAYARLKLNFNR